MKSADDFSLASGCQEALSGSEAASRVVSVQQMFGELRDHYVHGNFWSGCQACAEAEAAAKLVLAPEHGEWMPWIVNSIALAGVARDTRLLMAAFDRRQAMKGGEPSGLDVFLYLHRAVALGLGSAAATASLRSAFAAACTVRECDASGFINSWIPLKPPFGPRVRAAASLALGIEGEATEPQSMRERRGSDIFTTARMLDLSEARSADEERAAATRAVEAIRVWEEARTALETAAVSTAQSRAETAPQSAGSRCSYTLGSALSSPPFFFARAFETESRWMAAQQTGAEAVWRIEEALSVAECHQVLTALRSVLAVRGWDSDQYVGEPSAKEVPYGGDSLRVPPQSTSTDLPLSAVPQVELLVREAIFRRVLRPLAPPYTPPPALPEHLEIIDLFYLRYSAAPGEQRGLSLHRDGSLFSFNVLLNEPSDFEGGGTHFEPSGLTVQLARGAAVAHSGTVEHAGVPITSGERYLLVGFIGCVAYPYTASLAAHAERDSFSKYGGAAWDRTPTPAAVPVQLDSAVPVDSNL